MKKKLFISISIAYFLPLMLTLLQSCERCRNVKKTYFEVTNMFLVTKTYSGIYDNTEIPVSSINQISFWLRMDIRYYSSIQKFSGGFSAMALSCEDNPQSKETIKSIEVYSNKDFEGFSAGTNLIEIMKMRGMWRDSFADIPKYITLQFTVEEGYELIFKENAKPVAGIHQFRIIFTDSKNRVFEMNTEINFI